MQAKDIKTGHVYSVRRGGKSRTVMVISSGSAGYTRKMTRWYCKDLDTKREVIIKSAGCFIAEVETAL